MTVLCVSSDAPVPFTPEEEACIQDVIAEPVGPGDDPGYLQPEVDPEMRAVRQLFSLDPVSVYNIARKKTC